MRRRMHIGSVAFLLCLAVGCREGPRPHSGKAKDPPQVATAQNLPPLAGALSCSGRGCHADFERRDAKDQSPSSTSYTRWLHHDPHARAYQVLFEPLAQQMGKKLGMKVTSEPRCLVCHCTPLAARDEPWASEERVFGVGCEACHGPARDWLVPHRGADWNAMPGKTKQEKYGLMDLGSQAVRAGVCAGCHVGAPADPANGLPARDMNHDFIAAGHPRLMFEYSSFLANEPKHWKEKDVRPDFEVRAWLAGQAASANAALRLLADRAAAKGADRPWPEFSAYDCYACHHPLDTPAWRQERGYKAQPGNLRMENWSFALLPLADRVTRKSRFSPVALADLAKAMSKPLPSREQVRVQADALAKPLPDLTAALAQQTYDRASVAGLRKSLVEQYRAMKHADWDAVEQIALGLQALEAAYPDDERDAVVKKILGELAFPPDHNSPVKFPRKKELDALFGKLEK